jgi:hypothetical protein
MDFGIFDTLSPSPRRAASRRQPSTGCTRPSLLSVGRSVSSRPKSAFQLLIRSARGIELTAAGRAFLDHARIALAQAEAATEAARRAAHPAKPTFALGFLTGQEMDWLPEAMNVLRDELPKIEVTVSSQYSPCRSAYER